MKPARIYDSLRNLLTGLGVPGIDKGTASEFIEVSLSNAEKEAAYSSDWLSGKVCRVLPFDMTRQWRTFTGDLDDEKREDFLDLETRLEVRHKVYEAMLWARVYGGAGLLLQLDGDDPMEPLELDRVRQGQLTNLIVMDSQFLSAAAIENDPFSPNFGYPNSYTVAGSALRIHHSRVLRFEGVPLPLQVRRQNRYWGKSVIENLHSALLRAGEVQESIATLIHEASVDVIRIPDLMEMVSSPDTEAQLQTRFGVAKMMKSINRTLLLDVEEEYENHQQTFASLPEIIEKYLSIVAGAADVPITRLLGQSPAGLNSTGESDIRNYYDHVSALQETALRPKLEYLDQVLYRSVFGTDPDSDELTFQFNPLWQLSETDAATIETSKAQRDSVYLADGVINEAIIARDLMEREVYSGITPEYIDELEKAIEMEPEPEPEPPAVLPPFEETGGEENPEDVI